MYEHGWFAVGFEQDIASPRREGYETGENCPGPDSHRRTEMPKVDPSTNQPMSDEADSADDETRGGKQKGDAAVKGASSTGGGNIAEQKQ